MEHPVLYVYDGTRILKGVLSKDGLVCNSYICVEKGHWTGEINEQEIGEDEIITIDDLVPYYLFEVDDDVLAVEIFNLSVKYANLLTDEEIGDLSKGQLDKLVEKYGAEDATLLWSWKQFYESS